LPAARQLPAEVVEHIVQKIDGGPLFVEEERSVHPLHIEVVALQEPHGPLAVP
jgi:hypothetical protein